MKIAFFVNDVATEIPEYTTTRLALAATRMGHEVWLVGAGDAEYRPGGCVGGHAYRADAKESDDLESFLDRLRQPDSCTPMALDEMDAVMLRNDSIEDLHERPWAFNTGVLFGQMLAQRGVCVVNNPAKLSYTASKLYLQDFPEHVRPKGLASRNADEIRRFVEEVGPSVLKPLYGAKGRNVFLIDGAEDNNLNQMIEAVLEDGYVLAQERVEGVENGDLRFFLLDGEPLQYEGAYAAFRRVPEGNDLRANISTGGHSAPAEVEDSLLQMIGSMTDRLKKDGMFFAGIDVVGDKVIEINVESAGGFQSAEHFTGVEFSPAVIEAIEKRVASS